jgi:hypothetical protein
MGASQREVGEIVIERGGLPRTGGMALSAIGTEPATVIIIFCMAGTAVLRGALEHTVDVAG